MESQDPHYINSAGCHKSLFVTAKMLALHQRDFWQNLWVLLFSIQFDFHHDLQTEKDISEWRTIHISLGRY